MPRLRSHGVFFLLFGIGAACASPPSLPPPEVEYAGCKAVLVPGPVCVFDSKKPLRLWVGAPPDAQIEIRVDGTRIEATGEPVQDGQRFALKIPSGVNRVNVLVKAREGKASWSLALAEPDSEKVQEASHDVLGEVNKKLYRVHRSILDRDLAAVRGTLTGLQLPDKAPAESRSFLAYYKSLLAEREGDYRSALDENKRAIKIAERVKLERAKWAAEEELALLLRGIGRSRESAPLFERLRRQPYAKDACDEAQLLVNQAWSALLAREAGESFADPTSLLETALQTHEACKSADAKKKKVNILINLALAHLQEGRLRQAKDFLAQARELEPDPPLPQRLWSLDLEARIALSEGRPSEALHRFEELAELARETSSPDGRLRAALGQAQSHRVLGNQAAALATLTQAEALLDEQSLQIPVYEGRETFMATRQALVSLHVEILLDQGRNAQALDVARHARSRVLRQLEHGDRLADLTPDQRTQWQLLLTDYQTRRAALEERAKDDQKLPADQLRQEQEARRAEAEAAKKLLDQAFLLLGSPGVRPGDTPPAPRPGDLILAYHPLASGWVGFAADGRTVAARRFELPPEVLSRPEELAVRLLLPFRASIKAAKRVRILASGPLLDLDFHALPFDGDVLLASVPVVYGLDLPVSKRPGKPPGRRALLVADPESDLPGALAEARRVRQILQSEARPWSTEELKQAEASAAAVRKGFAAADLLHYAGHGVFSGFGGWESSLPLAGDTQLTLGDLLALDRVPAWIVLSACDTGRSSDETPVESLGLAHAFLLAGSRAVIASTRPADDRTVAVFFPDLYQHWDGESDLAVALQRAQLSWRQRNPAADWKSFRLFEP